MQEELRRSFPEVPWTPALLRRVARTAHAWDVQCRLEGMVVDEPERLEPLVHVDGLGGLREAHARGRGVVVVHPHAGAVALIGPRLAALGLPVVQVADRPPASWQWLADQVDRVRDAAERRQPVPVLRPPFEADVARALARGAVAVVPMDLRAAEDFVVESWLGRPANLALSPWRLAAGGAPIVPVVCLPRRDRGHALVLGPTADGADPAWRRGVLDWLEARLRSAPEAYGGWLLRCRTEAARDPRPLFADLG